MNLWIKAVPNENGEYMGRKEIVEVYLEDLNFVRDGTLGVISCVKKTEKGYRERMYIPLSEYEITIGQKKDDW